VIVPEDCVEGEHDDHVRFALEIIGNRLGWLASSNQIIEFIGVLRGGKVSRVM
jgi:hypothetical protein